MKVKLLILILIQITVSSVVFAESDCRQTVQPEVTWTMEQELYKRFQELSETPQIQNEHRSTFEYFLLKALNSSQNSRKKPNNIELLHEAVSDYITIIDFYHTNQKETVEQKLHRLLKNREYIFNFLKSNKNFQFEFGLSSEETLLQSWAFMKPIAALTKSTRNRYDGFLNASLSDVFLHDFTHYSTYLTRIQEMEPVRYGNRSEFSKIEMEQFKVKQRRASLLILRILEIIKSDSLFPDPRDKSIAREIAFAGLHEGKTIIDPKAWMSLSREQKKFIVYVVLNAIKRATKDHSLKNSPPSEIEIYNVIKKISKAVKERQEPLQIPAELM